MTGLSIFEPMREAVTLREALNRLFEDSFVPPAAPTRSLAMDVIETADAIIVKAALPGADKDKTDISFQGDTLTIKATIPNGDANAEGSRYLLHERFHGPVGRTLTLPVAVDADKASANYKDGVLILTLPKAESVKPRNIKVSYSN